MTWSEDTDGSTEHEPGTAEARDAAVAAYWATARKRAGLTRLDVVVGQQAIGSVQPPAWSFGSDPREADSLLGLVLSGRKTGTSSAAQPYAVRGESVPRPGDLSIILDGSGRPRALIVTTAIEVVPYSVVDAAHATAEGEGDLSLEHWRAVHAPFFAAELAEVGLSFDDDSEVVLERFRLLDPKRHTQGANEREPVLT